MVALSHLPRLIGDLMPYLALLAAFAGFVVWNGGVVLGKSQFYGLVVALEEYSSGDLPLYYSFILLQISHHQL